MQLAIVLNTPVFSQNKTKYKLHATFVVYTILFSLLHKEGRHFGRKYFTRLEIEELYSILGLETLLLHLMRWCEVWIKLTEEQSNTKTVIHQWRYHRVR